MDNDTKINIFAVRSFRDVADNDYISARLSYKYHLMPQFHWQSLQALEKYFKTIFLLNRVKAKKVKHSLETALDKLHELPFTVELSKLSTDFINHIATHGQFRYLETSWDISGPKLVELDFTVWELRRYCQILNYNAEGEDGVSINMLNSEIKKIKESKDSPASKFRIVGGELEKIIDDFNHPSRPALIWQNAFFCKKVRKKLKNVRTPFYAVNSPLSMHPEILDEIVQYVYMPDYLIKAYKEYYENKN